MPTFSHDYYTPTCTTHVIYINSTAQSSHRSHRANKNQNNTAQQHGTTTESLTTTPPTTTTNTTTTIPTNTHDGML